LISASCHGPFQWIRPAGKGPVFVYGASFRRQEGTGFFFIVRHLQHKTWKIWVISKCLKTILVKKLFRRNTESVLHTDNIIGIKIHIGILAASGKTRNPRMALEPDFVFRVDLFSDTYLSIQEIILHNL
jgi:hypothetical protein